jgi:Holliday junction DNA helicase RuvA
MIGLLRGRLAAREQGQLLLEVGGVGYEVSASAVTERALPPLGSEVTLHIHTQVKEDAIQLYGFADPEERVAFRILLGVSGIGPRTALALLSGLTVEELKAAVATRDLARLSSVPGIGKKTAERLVFELKNKLPGPRLVPAAAPLQGPHQDLLSALVHLGYKPAAAEKAAAAVAGRWAEGVAFEEVLREALRSLSRP